MRRPNRKGESGFALLLVFLMAAIIAIMLYMEMPRVAFELQRSKEQVLIDRGEQYKRAIKLFVQRFRRYPASIDQLENTNNIRFLRRRYKDPMTGKDDWRLIHVNGGVFTDSLTQKAPKVKGVSSSSDQPETAAETNPGQPAAPARWQIQRPGPVPGSTLPTGTEPEDQQAEEPPQEEPVANEPEEGALPQQGQQPPVPGQVIGAPGQESGQQQPVNPEQPQQQGQVIGGIAVSGGLATPGQPGVPGQPETTVQPGQPGVQPYQPGFMPQPGQPGFQQGQPGLRFPFARPGVQPNVPGQRFGPVYPVGVSLPGMQNPQPQPSTEQPTSNPALESINQSLRGGTSNASTLSGSSPIGGGGIAGVASKFEGPSIKVYQDHSKYNEWEFIYDPRKDTTSPLGNLPVPGAGSGQRQQLQQQQQQQQQQ